MFTILVCGGRDFGHIRPNASKKEKETRLAQYEFIQRTLDKLSLDWPRTPEDEYGNWLPAVKVITGGATGADAAAADWAAVNWTGFKSYPAMWKLFGKAAGPIRNREMLREEKPDVVVAFPGGPGTDDMIRVAKKGGVKVIEIEWSDSSN